MESFYEKIDKFEEQIKSISEILVDIIVELFFIGVKITPIRLIPMILLVAKLDSLAFFTEKPLVGLLVEIVLVLKEAAQLTFLCMMQSEEFKDDEDFKLSTLLKSLKESTQDLLETLQKPFKGLSEKKKETKVKKQEKIKLKEESELTTKVENSNEITEDIIMDSIKEISTLTDSLSEEKKVQYKSELKTILSEYTSTLKELVIIYEDKDDKIDSLSLESMESLTMKTIKKLVLMELKVQKDLTIEGKLKQIDEEKQEVLDFISDESPVLKI